MGIIATFKSFSFDKVTYFYFHMISPLKFYFLTIRTIYDFISRLQASWLIVAGATYGNLFHKIFHILLTRGIIHL